ncbi:MAG: hypothetical protein JJU45_11290 [Acidimicrobiia bacterium]|nr:hypothetical protein [Acidimicrobiia bacterium]
MRNLTLTPRTRLVTVVLSAGAVLLLALAVTGPTGSSTERTAAPEVTSTSNSTTSASSAPPETSTTSSTPSTMHNPTTTTPTTKAPPSTEPSDIDAPATDAVAAPTSTPAPAEAAAPTPRAPRLVVIGASITVGSAELTRQAFGERGWDVHVDGIGGRTITERLDDVRAVAADAPDVFIMNLGTNDAVCLLREAFEPGSCPQHPGYVAEQVQASLDAALAAFDPSRTCVVAVTTTFADMVNGLLEERHAAGAFPVLADWRPHVAANPGYERDDIGHLTPEGNVAYVQHLVDAVDGGCSVRP